MQNYKNTVQDTAGNSVVGASVLVNLGGTATPATIYSDDGVTVVANPLATDANGQFTFWAPPGLYDFVISGSTFPTRYWNSVQLYDLAGPDAPWFDVTDTAYGAKGDGVTDDSAAVQLAATAATGGVLYFPAGKTFLIENEVTLAGPVTLAGGGTILCGVTGEFTFRATTQTDIAVDGLVINGGSAAAVFNGTAYPGIFGIYDCDRVSIRNCRIYDSGADGIYIGGTAGNPCTQVHITGNIIQDSRRDGIAIVNATDVTVADNEILGTFGAGIDIEANAGCDVSRVEITGNRCHCTRTTNFDLNSWPRSLDIGAAGTAGAIVVSGNHFSYMMPDAYLATAAADATHTTVQVIVSNITGPLSFTGNLIETNQMSDEVGNYGLVTFGGPGQNGVSSGLVYAGNTIYRPETVPAVASGEGHALWKGLVIRGCDNSKITGRVKGSFNEPVLVYDCNNIELDLNVENTADSIAANVTSAITVDTCNDIKLTGYFSSPDNTIVLDTVDGMLLEGAILKSANGGVHIRNQGAASGSVVAANCLVDQSDSEPFPNTAMSRNDDGNAIASFVEINTVDKALVGGGSASLGLYNVKSYGALGDGATDDAASIQAAIDAAEAARGGIVFFPPGRYSIETALTVEDSGITLQGSSAGKDTSTADGTVITPGGAVAFGPLLTIGTAAGRTYGSGIRDIHIYGTYIANGILKMLNCTECFASDCRFDLAQADDDARIAVHLDTSAGYPNTENVFTRCIVFSPRLKTGAAAGYGYGVVISNTGYTDGDPEFNTRNRFEACRFQNGATDIGGKLFQTEDSAVGRNIVNSCTFFILDGDQGITLGGAYGGDVFSGCQVQGDGSEVLTFEAGAEDCVFIGNIVGGTWSDANAEAEKAIVMAANDDNGPQFRALTVIARSAAPASPVPGTLYYDAEDNKLYVWTSAAWTDLTV